MRRRLTRADSDPKAAHTLVLSHRPAGDWLIGLPFFVCSALALTAATVAWRFFRGHKELRAQPA